MKYQFFPADQSGDLNTEILLPYENTHYLHFFYLSSKNNCSERSYFLQQQIFRDSSTPLVFQMCFTYLALRHPVYLMCNVVQTSYYVFWQILPDLQLQH